MKYYLATEEEVLQEVSSSYEGLSEDEAARRLQANGKNKLIEPKKDSLIKRFFMQMADPMILILLVAAVISAVTAIYSGESFADVFIILFVVIVNAVLGVVQESKAEQAIEALKEMTSATSRVERAGVAQSVKSEDLVVGDVVLLEAGDAVPADVRILESHSIRSEEAALTGESVPSEKQAESIVSDLGEGKDIPLGDRKNMAYMGSTIVYGRGKAVVTGTGMDTEVGKIADAISQAKQEQTPLQLKLNQLSKVLTYLVLGVCLFIFAFDILMNGDFSGEAILNTFLVAVSLAVAAIPEGLAAVVTIVLSIGVTKMSKRNAVIRRLTAVETLGSTQIICSDKTGTLTQNKMTVVDTYGPDKAYLATAMALSSDSYLNDNNEAVGEPTENALVNFAYKENLPKYELEKAYPRVGEAPFDSMRKLMSTVHTHDTEIVQFTKGAPDEVLKKCTSIMTENGVEPLTEEKKQVVLDAVGAMAHEALRVLGAAYRKYDQMPASDDAAVLEQDLTFIGLTGMIDPIRPEVKDAIDECNKAGIRAIMITGDHKDTAVAIAKQLGILQEGTTVVTGIELDDMDDEYLKAHVKEFSVYARVQPEHKVRIVTAWRATGAITAMTGDGVNDAASIKSADIGIGMGITGTDVTKNVADMVLADDNFATIVSAVQEGRKIYDNIKKCIQFLLASNLSEVLSIFTATLLGFTILEPVHILWINLITDSFPALALGMEQAEDDLMLRAPRPSKDGIFAGGVGVDVAYQGVLVTILTLAAYFIGHYIESGVWEITNSHDGMTMAFITMSMAEIFHSFNMRSQRGSLFKMKHQNKWLYGAAALSFILTVCVIYIPPVANLFGFTTISLMEYGIAMVLALSIIPLVEIVKAIQRGYAKRKAK